MSAPKPGTPACALAALNLLATNRALVETDDLVAAYIERYQLRLLYGTEHAAKRAAAFLDITSEPRRRPSGETHDGFDREGTVAGVTVAIASIWPIASLAGAA